MHNVYTFLDTYEAVVDMTQWYLPSMSQWQVLQGSPFVKESSVPNRKIAQNGQDGE